MLEKGGSHLLQPQAAGKATMIAVNSLNKSESSSSITASLSDLFDSDSSKMEVFAASNANLEPPHRRKRYPHASIPAPANSFGEDSELAFLVGLEACAISLEEDSIADEEEDYLMHPQKHVTPRVTRKKFDQQALLHQSAPQLFANRDSNSDTPLQKPLRNQSPVHKNLVISQSPFERATRTLGHFDNDLKPPLRIESPGKRSPTKRPPNKPNRIQSPYEESRSSSSSNQQQRQRQWTQWSSLRDLKISI